ncbi:integral membrane protein PTH11 [Apiospora arundinis]|uniref:Integral membrane protein PTH11 n=1 Tax=Apiospora arundinis TaxID=335852 RepID=A0ABR2JFR2_9PEZI
MDVDAAAAAMQAAIMAAVHAAITEIWTLYGIGSTLIACRLFVRLKMVGFRGLQPDDYIALWVFVVYTSVSVVGHVLILDAGGKHTSQLSPQDRINLPESDYALFEYGTKLFLVGETLYMGVVWSLKLCMAFFYRRLVRGLWSEKLILPLIGGICATFLAGIITVYTTCVPVSKQWQILPDPGPLCVPQNPWVMITVLCLNLATDVCILSLPIPVLARMQTTTFRKIGLVFLFGLGAFTMVAAVLRIVSIFVLKQESAGALWSIREDFIAVVVTQAPMVYPLFGRRFWTSAYGTGSASKGESYYKHKSGPGESHELRSGGQQHSRKAKDPYSLTQLGITQVGGSESQEEMIAEPPNQAEAAAMAAAAAAANENAMHNRNLNQNQNPNFSRTLSAPKMRVPPERRVVVQQTVTTSVSPRQQQIDAEDRRRMEQPWEI